MSLSAAVKQAYPFLDKLGIEDVNAGCFDGQKWSAGGAVIEPVTPITGKPIGPKVQLASLDDTKRAMANIQQAKRKWMVTPAPKRGEIVRQIGDELRANVDDLGSLLALEVGKIYAEGKGEVQEYIDICDFATGLSRQIPGQVLPSERPGHFMMEQWHPLGAIGIIAAFNFPVAVPGWNAAISLVCGNTQIWKCSPTTCLSAIATQRIMNRVLERHGFPSVAAFVAGDRDVGELMVDSPSLNLISFTGSCAAGNLVNQRVAKRFGRCLLELGGNNAITVLDDADIELTLRSVVFGAVGTCGQRCTTCRRLYLHEKIYDQFVQRAVAIYGRFKIGSPLEPGVLVGPLHTASAVDIFEHTVARALKEGGKILFGGKAFRDSPQMPGPNYVEPTIIEIDAAAPVVQEEAFVPILYVMRIGSLEQAIEYNNGVSQGLSSSVFTSNVRSAHFFLSAAGADTGIVNVNVPTNGAEIGGAFGGEKSTGGGRESGSDSWKQYMRRVTSTLNYSTQVPLAQGISFDP